MVRRAAALATAEGHADRGYRTIFNCNHDAGQTVCCLSRATCDVLRWTTDHGLRTTIEDSACTLSVR
jgi:hypothetical protein